MGLIRIVRPLANILNGSVGCTTTTGSVCATVLGKILKLTNGPPLCADAAVQASVVARTIALEVFMVLSVRQLVRDS